MSEHESRSILQDEISLVLLDPDTPEPPTSLPVDITEQRDDND